MKLPLTVNGAIIVDADGRPITSGYGYLVTAHPIFEEQSKTDARELAHAANVLPGLIASLDEMVRAVETYNSRTRNSFGVMSFLDSAQRALAAARSVPQ